jgi:CDP-2,3-bis-(O-geranylgeranyl)-sn-glycerol synthase
MIISMFEPPLIVYSLVFILPAYVANSVPVILGGVAPMDFGRNFFDKRRILGNGKTWYGFFGGLFCGILASIALAFILPGSELDVFGGRADYYLASGILLSSGALFGDLAGSFIKRRIGAKHGQSMLLDQLTFILGAFAFCYPLGLSLAYRPENIIFLVLATYFIHRMANSAAHYMGLKRVPW